MKKRGAILMMIVFFSSFMYAQPQLSFRFSNPDIIKGNPNLLKFDIEIKAHETNTFLRDLQIYFDYNPSAFGFEIGANGKVTVSNLALMLNHYQIVNQIDNTSSKYAVIIEATEEMNHNGSAIYFNEVPVTYTGLMQFQIEIADTNQICGIGFDPNLMNGGQYMQATTSTNPISYQFTSIYEYSLSNLSLKAQEFYLTTGWSGISGYLIPFNPELENLFYPIMNELVILQNFEGYYLPDGNVNTLGNWNSASGYMIKVNSNCELRMMGSELDDKTSDLMAGWNVIPVLAACEVNTAELFSEILSNVIIVKEVAGTGVYWPAIGINTLPFLKPGKAYFVKMAATEQIEYPGCDLKR